MLDLGCGTGTFALILARRGVEVVAVDPARASLDVARAKPGADRVRWVHGDATAVPTELRGRVDLAVMTGNVALDVAFSQPGRRHGHAHRLRVRPLRSARGTRPPGS